MDVSTWFDTPVIGELTPGEAIDKLREIGEFEDAEQLERAEQQPSRSGELGKLRWPFKSKPWQHTSHTFGYIQPSVQKVIRSLSMLSKLSNQIPVYRTLASG
ncbi:MAG: hypothetical protein IMW89_02630 [Ktedonobacteraceae bacterium]|nr:hypothetical protein [Ktedonobacteraceae bacterium]